MIFLAVFAVGFGAGTFGAASLKDGRGACAKDPCTDAATQKDAAAAPTEFVKLGNQFVVSVVRGDTVKAVVVLSLSVEVSKGQREAVFAREPRLRAEFLKVLFDHANIGGFDGQFMAAGRMERLRRGLFQIAKAEVGDAVQDVLITEIARQEIG